MRKIKNWLAKFHPSGLVDTASLTETLSNPKVYRAVMSQGGTAVPVPTILENNLGVTPVWTRIGAGNYESNLSSFDLEHTKLVLPTFIAFDDRLEEGDAQCVWVQSNVTVSEQKISIRSTDQSGIGMDGFIDGMLIEILLYD